MPDFFCYFDCYDDAKDCLKKLPEFEHGPFQVAPGVMFTKNELQSRLLAYRIDNEIFEPGDLVESPEAIGNLKFIKMHEGKFICQFEDKTLILNKINHAINLDDDW